MSEPQKTAEASLETLHRIFTVPEAPDSTLARLEAGISANLHGFLREHIVATRRSMSDIEDDFTDTRIPEDPVFVSEQAEFLMRKVVAESVHTASPTFVGHMTSALPYFMLPLAKMMIALNQNTVKTETSKAFTPLERQVLGILHRLVFGNDDAFYARYVQDSRHALGAFCSGGTVANLTALWVARNNALPADGSFEGVSREGLHRALAHHGYDDAAIVVSRLGHYSIGKAADLLGLGVKSVHAVEVDAHNHVDLTAMERTCRRLRARGVKIIALIGLAGTTETGSVDALAPLAELAAGIGTHFHVDAAWGGPTLFSSRWRHLLAGIEHADSVTLDAHKQLYVPMGSGMTLFRDPSAARVIEHHARYVIREGSRDLGSKTLEGSRPGMAMLVHSGLAILGRRGYELLIDTGIDNAQHFAAMVRAAPDFELTSEPELNILTYRHVPQSLQQALASADAQTAAHINEELNAVTRDIQRLQRAAGKSFVSRTTLHAPRHRGQAIDVFRVVLANPLTDLAILAQILDEQRALAAGDAVAARLAACLAALGLPATRPLQSRAFPAPG
jgi:glutamate decarboxylase